MAYSSACRSNLNATRDPTRKHLRLRIPTHLPSHVRIIRLQTPTLDVLGPVFPLTPTRKPAAVIAPGLTPGLGSLYDSTNS